MWYDVRFVYQNIESGGSTRYRTSYKIEADSEGEAVERGVKRLGCNLDGKIFSTSVKPSSKPTRRINFDNIPCSED